MIATVHAGDINIITQSADSRVFFDGMSLIKLIFASHHFVSVIRRSSFAKSQINSIKKNLGTLHFYPLEVAAHH